MRDGAHPREMAAGRLIPAGLLMALAALWAAAPAVRADVRLPEVFSDHLVLQQGVPVSVWGWAAPGEEVTVSFAGQNIATHAGADGRWMVRLQPLKPGGPAAEMTVTGRNTLRVRDVLVGEVWVCAGQSNMELSLSQATGGEQEAARAADTQIRFFEYLIKKASAEPLPNVRGRWVVCTPETAARFSAVAYYFGRDLRQATGRPVGLIPATMGGSLAEAWISPVAFQGDKQLAAARTRYEKDIQSYLATLRKAVADWEEAAAQARAKGQPVPPAPPPVPDPQTLPGAPSSLYNGLVAPIIPLAIAGVAWYQGESNVPDSEAYRHVLTALIGDWRRAWGQGDFPFLVVQLPNHQARGTLPEMSLWAELRESQARAMALPRTALVVTIDLGDAVDIHPKNKQDVGRRLALAARAVAYGEKIVYSGPVYDSMTVEGGAVRLRFTHIGGGLESRGATLFGFVVAGEDKKFVSADAKIEGDTVVVSSRDVAKPVAVRYAWADNPACNLYNKDGLPAPPFRTDDWPLLSREHR